MTLDNHVRRFFSPAVCCLVVTVSTALAAAPREMGLLPTPTGDLLGFEIPGDVPVIPAEGELVVEKLRPADCRHVLGFVHPPVDGRIDTWGTIGFVNEYNDSQNYGRDRWVLVTYQFIDEPGIHVTLPDDLGFNYLILRGGFEGKIYRDVEAIDGPGGGTLIADVNHSRGPQEADYFKVRRIAFPQAVTTQRVSFFRRSRMLTDISFYRVGAAATPKHYRDALSFTAGHVMGDLSPLGLDFIQLPAARPDEQHPSNFHRRFFRPTDRVVYTLGGADRGNPVALAASQQVHFITPPLEDHLAVGAVRVDLRFDGISEGDLVHLTVQDPLIGNQELLRIDVRAAASPAGGGRVAALLDFPDQILPSRGRLWITIASDKPATLAPASKFIVLTVDRSVALAEHIPWRLLLLKGYYQVLSEARPFTMQKWDVQWLTEYDGREWRIQRVRPQLLDLYRTVEHFRSIAPDHPIAIGQYDRWLNRGREELLVESDVPTLPEIDGVPRWATLLSKAIESQLAIPRWWMEHRMTPRGELGGMLGDDCDFFPWWTPLALMDSEGFGAEVRRVFPVIAEHLKRENLRDGINIRATDPLHAYEEGQNHFAMMPLLFYGDPYYVEELMTAARSVEKAMYRTPEGGLRFGVERFGWETAYNPPAQRLDRADHSSKFALLLHSHLMLAWYSHHPHALDVLQRYADAEGGWVDGAYGGGPHISFAVYWLTGDPKYLGLAENGMQGRNPWARFQPVFVQHAKEAWDQTWWPNYVASHGSNWKVGYWAWAAARRTDVLEQALIYEMYGNPVNNGGGTVKFKYMWTEAEVWTDRVFLPVETLAQAMLGGFTVRNYLWPAYAVSYENLGSDFAALVLEQGKDRLKLAMVNLRDQPRRGAFRPWQLDHGRYELAIHPEGDESDKQARTLELARMDRIDVALPPRKVMIYELKQLEKLDDLYARADLAIGPRDVARHGETVTVTVHNIGSAPADAVVALVDDAGKVLTASQPVTLEAPLDMIPRTAEVTLPWVQGAAAVVVDPARTVPQITELNNRVRLP